MATMLLIVIYIAFLGRGMPDSITGVAWTKMFVEFGVSEGSVSIVTVTISLSTAIISLFCARLISRFGTFKVALAATVLLSLTLFGYFLAPSFIFVCLLALPLGVGASQYPGSSRLLATALGCRAECNSIKARNTVRL